LALTGLGLPAALLLLLAVTSLAARPLAERWTGALAASTMTASFASMVGALVLHAMGGPGPTVVAFPAWSTARGGHMVFEVLLDGTSLLFAVLVVAVAGVVAAFSNRYLHREPGYNRYFFLFAMFVTGMLLVALAGSVEVLFAGWECVGLSSALLVAFFHQRPAAVANALRVFTVYRISDAAMLSAAVLLHYLAGSGSLVLLFGDAPPDAAGLSSGSATAIAVLLVVAAAGKSALLPFSGWLPRAMEGPTPSSAVYYGSLSIHAGCFLLLRAAPLLEAAPAARLLAGSLGVCTTLFASATARVQSDVKSSLAYASLSQVGIIVVEIALGLYGVAFVHLAGHACLRLLQFLSAPNVLHDLHEIESVNGPRTSWGEKVLGPVLSLHGRRRLYLLALERGFLDALLDEGIAKPFERLASWMARVDRFLCEVVSRPAATSPTGDDPDLDD
jgi:NAD(P)H-quinone oxidoreductase subunit 5